MIWIGFRLSGPASFAPSAGCDRVSLNCLTEVAVSALIQPSLCLSLADPYLAYASVHVMSGCAMNGWNGKLATSFDR